MKKTYLALIIPLLLVQFSYAQWTTSGSNIYNSNTGNVGIGTTGPPSALAVTPATFGYGLTNEASNFLAGTLSSLNVNAGSYLYPFEFQHANSGGNIDRLQITPYRRVAGTTWPGTAYRLQFAVDNSFTDGSKAFIEVGASDPSFGTGGFISLGTAGVDRIAINNSGNVGIGTISPANKLDVQGSVSTIPSGGFWVNGTRSAGIADEGNGGAGDGSIFFRSGNTDGRMVINSLGNVLIGQTSQHNTGYILDVAGNVRANSVVINSTGADFVFARTYHLSSLESVKKYIDKNHHLPEIASAKEMQNNGLNVGENQTKLLQKVEELTLYLIEIKMAKEKKEKEQRALNRAMLEQIKKLQMQVGLIKTKK